MRWVLLLLLLLLALLWIWRELARPVPPRAADGDAWDPWSVLGVPRGASAEALAQAYRERLKEYHPDRVAALGPELRELAHRKTLDIQRAYAELSHH
jgi:DnaJ like chaperone protein